MALPSTLTAEQQLVRSTGITGSEIAALAGVSRYKSAIDVYADKVAPAPPDDRDSHHVERGVFLEEGLLRWYAWRTGRRLEYPGTLRHPLYPLVVATPDALACGHGERPRVVECKCPDWRIARDWGADGTAEIPAYYMPQVQWEMAVAGCLEADVIALIDGDLKIYTVPWNQRLFDALLTIAQLFWGDHVRPRIPPPPEASVAYGDYLRRVYPEATQPALADTPVDAVPLLRQLDDATAALEWATKQRDAAKHGIMAMLEAAAGMQGAWGTIYYKNNKPSPRTDWRAVAIDAGASQAQIDQFTTQPDHGPRVFRAYITNPECLNGGTSQPSLGSPAASESPATGIAAPAGLLGPVPDAHRPGGAKKPPDNP